MSSILNRMAQLLPVGKQDFPSLRETGYCYVDKTPQIHELVTHAGDAVFLSRPRRFGKTLICSTLEAIFRGRRELFAEIAGQPALAINSLDWAWTEHPVIRLDLNKGNHSLGCDHVVESLRNQIISVAREYELALRGKSVDVQFDNLILDLHRKSGKRVVVII
ncbi:MAG: AAA family ATPase, partial [Polyangiaceae bacterium]|nr:AAA family ATPase [Polyangiaceae bacterium]